MSPQLRPQSRRTHTDRLLAAWLLLMVWAVLHQIYGADALASDRKSTRLNSSHT